MTSAIAGFGAKVNWNSVDIAEAQNIQFAGQSVDMIDVSNHDSANEFREFIAGLVDGGEVSFEANFKSTDTTGQIAMHTDFQAKTSRTCQLTLPDSLGNISGAGYVSKFEFSFPHDGPAKISVSVKYTGKPTLTIS